MTTITATHPHFDMGEHEGFVDQRITRYAVPVGRLMFAAIFLMAVRTHFSVHGITYAADQGVPLAALLVPASGLLALIGGLSIALGYKARLGAFLIAVFLVPVTLTMHKFWNIADPQQAMIQQVMFMKNVAMLGAALLLAHFGSGPFSIDAWRMHKATS